MLAEEADDVACDVEEGGGCTGEVGRGGHFGALASDLSGVWCGLESVLFDEKGM